MSRLLCKLTFGIALSTFGHFPELAGSRSFKIAVGMCVDMYDDDEERRVLFRNFRRI